MRKFIYILKQFISDNRKTYLILRYLMILIIIIIANARKQVIIECVLESDALERKKKK